MFPIFADLRQYRGKCCDYGKQQYKDKTYTRLPTTKWIYRNIRSISLVEFIAINRKKQENGKKLKLLSILIHLVMLVPLRLALLNCFLWLSVQDQVAPIMCSSFS